MGIAEISATEDNVAQIVAVSGHFTDFYCAQSAAATADRLDIATPAAINGVRANFAVAVGP